MFCHRCFSVVVLAIALLQCIASSEDKLLPFAGEDPILFYFKDGAVMTFKTENLQREIYLQMTKKDSHLKCAFADTGDEEQYEFIVHVVKSGQIALQSRKYPSKWFPKEAADLKSDLKPRYPGHIESHRIAIQRKGSYQPYSSPLVEIKEVPNPTDGPVKYVYLMKGDKYLTAKIQPSGSCVVTEEAEISRSAMFKPHITDERHELIVSSDNLSGHILAQGSRVEVICPSKKRLRMGHDNDSFPVDGLAEKSSNAAMFEVLVRPPATADGAPDGKVCLRNVFVGDEVNDQGTGGWLRMNKKGVTGKGDGQKGTELLTMQIHPDQHPHARTMGLLKNILELPVSITDPDTAPLPSKIVLESVKCLETDCTGKGDVIALSIGASGLAASAQGQQDDVMDNDDYKFEPHVMTHQHKDYTRAGDTINLRTLTHGNVISLISKVTGQALRIDDNGNVSADGDYQQADAQFFVSVRRPKPTKGSDLPAVVALQSVKDSSRWIRLFVGPDHDEPHVDTGGGGFECNFQAIEEDKYLLFQSVHFIHTDYLGIESSDSKKAVAIHSNLPDTRAYFTPRVIQSSPYLRFTAGSSGHMLTFEEGRTIILRSLNCRGSANDADERGLRVHPPTKITEKFPPRIECQGARGSEARFLVRVIAPGVVALKSEHIAEVVDKPEQWWIDLHKTEPIDDVPLEIDGVIQIYSKKDSQDPNVRDNYTYLRGDGGSHSNLQLETYQASDDTTGKSNTYVRLRAQLEPLRRLGAIYQKPHRDAEGDDNEVYCDPVIVIDKDVSNVKVTELWTPIDPLFHEIYEFSKETETST